MFIEQGIRPENKFWKYLAGSAIVIFASFVGNLPLFFGMAVKTVVDKVPFPDQSRFMSFLSPNLTLFLIMLSFVFAIVALFIVIKKLHGQTILSVTTSRKKTDWRRILFSSAIWAVLNIAMMLYSYFESPQDYLWNFKPIPFLILTIISLVMIPIQTATEEYIFRGYLMQGFANLARNRWFPLVMTSLIFGGLHFFNPEVSKMGNSIMVFYIGTGLFLGIITLMDEGMELSLGFHAANNITGALFLTSDWTVFQTNSIFKDVSNPNVGFDVLFPVVIIFPLLLFIFSKKYGWTGWIQKLTGKIEINPETIPENNTKNDNSNHDSDLSQRTQQF